MDLIAHIVASVFAFVAGLLTDILAHDICMSADRVCTRIIRHAARRMAPFDPESVELEWLSDLSERETVYEKYHHAVGCYVVAGGMRRRALTVKLNDVDALIQDLGHKHSSTVAQLRAAKEQLGQNDITRQEFLKRQKATLNVLLEGPNKRANLAVEKAVRSLDELINTLSGGMGRASALLTACVDSSVERLDHVQSLILKASEKRDRITELLGRRPMPTDLLGGLLAELDSDLRTVKNVFADDKWGNDDAYKEQKRITTAISDTMSSLRAARHPSNLRRL